MTAVTCSGVGLIGNYYGGLELAIDGGRFYWGLRDWDGIDWQEIPESLYESLMEYQQSGAGLQRLCREF